MPNLIDIDKYPVRDVLKILLQDKTTGKSIFFATDMYLDYGYSERNPMTESAIIGLGSIELQPRVCKAQTEQSLRTRKKAEVFTPTWLCNSMNNHCDSDWFGRDDVFNRTDSEKSWRPTEGRVVFPKGKNWQKYVDSRRLEITCGEAPYLVSRYDTTTGEQVPIKERVGILDRKLRVVSENAADETEWLKWTVRAFQSVYGYEFQGDNLLIARINLLMTFCDYVLERWNREATQEELRKLANIISWNIWQMDGLADTVPIGAPEERYSQITLLGDEIPATSIDCKIQDWRDKRPKLFRKIKDKKERGISMKFDYVIGNPPYQEETENNGRQSPVYNKFMDEAYKVADCVELITPARFLFNAGQTPKAWNDKMLQDEHFKVLKYESDASKVFANTDIKGGVAISIRDTAKKYGAIKVFTSHEELNAIVKRVSDVNGDEPCLDSIISSRGNYRTTDLFFTDFPFASERLGAGTGNMIASNFFEKLPEVYSNNNPDSKDCIGILCRVNNKRTFCYIKKCYVLDNSFIDGYNVACPKSNGNGVFGEALTSTEILEPNQGATDTFISIGSFKTHFEAESLQKYIKTKFFRALLGVKKVTQDNPKSVWNMIPLQNFTKESDIDWSKSISEIDKHLYEKYSLSEEEIAFIETNVKEMK